MQFNFDNFGDDVIGLKSICLFFEQTKTGFESWMMAKM